MNRSQEPRRPFRRLFTWARRLLVSRALRKARTSTEPGNTFLLWHEPLVCGQWAAKHPWKTSLHTGDLATLGTLRVSDNKTMGLFKNGSASCVALAHFATTVLCRSRFGFALRSVHCTVEMHVPDGLATLAKPRAADFTKPATMYTPDSRFLLALAIAATIREESIGFTARKKSIANLLVAPHRFLMVRTKAQQYQCWYGGRHFGWRTFT